VAQGDPCFGTSYNRVRAALVEAVVVLWNHDRKGSFWSCQLCESRWPMSLSDMAVRHHPQHHDESCVLSAPYNPGSWAPTKSADSTS